MLPSVAVNKRLVMVFVVSSGLLVNWMSKV